MAEKLCRRCQHSFAPTKRGVRYCSDACRTAARKQQTRIYNQRAYARARGTEARRTYAREWARKHIAQVRQEPEAHDQLKAKWRSDWRERVVQMSSEDRAEHLQRQREAYKRWQRRYPGRHRLHGKTSRLRLKLEVLSVYGGNCACCGEGRHEFLAIDHIAGGGRQHVLSLKQPGKGWTLYQSLRNEAYPPGYRVLCHNCNHSLGLLGYCPHQELVPQPA